MTRLAFLCATGQDTGGWNIRTISAMRWVDGWEARSMAATRTYLEYPVDLPYRRDAVYGWWSRADVVVLHNTTHGWKLYDQGQGKPVVLQHHGTIFREDHARISREARRIGMVEIASTIDLTLLEPDVAWVPVPYDRAPLAALRETASRRPRTTEGVRIAHAPTNRRVKGTDVFLAAYEAIASRHDVELVLIERQPNRRCLELKATADVFYDQLELGYGCNAVEAWAMGIPVVAGVADPSVRSAMASRFGRLPFAEATPDTLERVLESLVVSERARREVAEIGVEHFDRFHDERVVAPILAEIYESAESTEPGPVDARRRSAA